MDIQKHLSDQLRHSKALAAMPRYRAIAQIISDAMASGLVSAGEKLPPLRVLATALCIHVGTVSRAYALLERQQRVTCRVGDGTYVRAQILDARQAPPHAIDDKPSPLAHPLIDLAHNVVETVQPLQELRITLSEISADPCVLTRVLGYTDEVGYADHRRCLSRWLCRFGLPDDPSCVALTCGGQHALACLLRVLTVPGDVVLCEALSYPGIVPLAQHMRLQLIAVNMDAQGLLPEELERACRTHHSRLLFCMPTLHNPTTATMDEQRRCAIFDIVRRHHLHVIEDAVPNMAMEEQPAALASYLPEQVFMIGSFSKALAPGLRIGFIRTPIAWMGKLAAVIRAHCWMASPLSAEIICRWLEHGVMCALLEARRRDNGLRQSLVNVKLKDFAFRAHPEGNHVWLPLPPGFRSSTFADALRRHGVLVKSLDAFAMSRYQTMEGVRICLSATADMTRLSVGLDIVVRLLLEDPSHPQTADGLG